MRDRLENGEIGLAFHGSSQKISQFSRQKVGKGGDANSSLGLCLSHCPLNALDYAESSNKAGEGEHVLVYVVAYPSSGHTQQMSPDAFFGILDDDSLAPATHFAEMRSDLLTRGFDRVECDTGEDAITVVLNPDRCIIVAVLDPDAVEAIECSGIDCMDSLALLEVITPYIPLPGRTRTKAVDTHEYS